ncbi:GNAT family N-acetyltransferase [Polyangium sp. 6x1]|uniref:GNAT family N-acetyltransferase n=1 Tax=Polyangium sp. 6x1 TaxID=3042689 RepID=UPI002482E508|nr:GNAT family N-acetyltransferase [Polyangium sp. 6x1]MDI1443502.1 GNAT family N-acetyltransferase [Polyangium sp. 6x1]
MLIDLASERYTSVRRFFAPEYPNLAFVLGVLERKLPGRVWVVPAEQDFAACLIVTDASFCFAAGALDPETLDAMLALVMKTPPITFIHPQGLDVSAAAARYGLMEGERRQLGAPAGGPGCPDIEVPSPFELVRIDGDLFRNSNWKGAVHRIFGSTENFLAYHYGFGLLLDGQLITEAHGVVGGGHVEIGTYTHEAYRRTGLSNVVCAAVKKHSEKLGLRAEATCDVDKAASIALSYRIGLQDDFRYKVLKLPT